MAETLAMILRNAGHEAAVAYDGPSAFERAESFQPDCVISDVVLPGMNGIDTCGVIQSKYPKSHILLFSGQAETNALVEEARAKGYTWELLAKPIEPDELLEKLEFVERTAVAG